MSPGPKASDTWRNALPSIDRLCNGKFRASIAATDITKNTANEMSPDQATQREECRDLSIKALLAPPLADAVSI
jgi:hypothetical protein